MKCVTELSTRIMLALGLVLAAPAAPQLFGTVFGTIAEAAVASRIVVNGNNQVEDSTVISYMTIRTGRSYTQADIDASVKALFASQLFGDVNIRARGNTLVVSVTENPMIARVVFVGEDRIKEKDLKAVTKLKERGFYTDSALQVDLNALNELYRSKGRTQAVITHEVNAVSGNRVEIIYRITEGEKTGVVQIGFIGNDALSDSKLQGVMKTKEHGILSWLTKDDVYDPLKLENDEELIRNLYFRRGYADFEITSTDVQFNDEKQGYTILITVSEGARYDYGDINLESDIPGVSADEYRNLVETRAGRKYNSSEVEKTIDQLTTTAVNAGNVFATVRPRGFRNYDTNEISITYVLEEGPRRYVERINIVGNTRTRDFVIRRELDFAEGDAFNGVLIKRAERRLRALDYFTSVRITTSAGSSADKVIVNIQIVDKATGEFGAGAGWSSTEGVVGTLSISERNLLGRGQYMRLAVSGGKSTRTYELSFNEPFFLGRRLSAGFDLYQRSYERTEYRAYDLVSRGGQINFAAPLTDEITLGAAYGYSRDRYSNISGKVKGIPAGTRVISKVIGSVTYDSTDNPIDPRNGVYANGRVEFAGVGGTVNFLRSEVSGRYYKEIIPDTGLVAMVRGSAGAIYGVGGSVAALDHFQLDSRHIRGFAPSGIGPRYGKQYASGGKYYASSTAELSFPLLGSSDVFRGAVFGDAATLFGVDKAKKRGIAKPNDKSIRASAGVGLMVASPFGLIRADFGWALLSQKKDDQELFSISVGRGF